MIQVRNEGERVVIGRVVKGGAAERSGNLHPGGRDHDYDDDDDDHDYEEEEIRVKAAHNNTIAPYIYFSTQTRFSRWTGWSFVGNQFTTSAPPYARYNGYH